MAKALIEPTLPPRSASLLPFFAPQGVAVIGASRDPSKLSFGLMCNLADPGHGYPGPVYPVNPKSGGDILGLRCYPDIGSVPDPVELAVLIIPAVAVPAAMEACGRRGVKAAIIISGGFRETGPEGAAREQEVVDIARRFGMRVIGPNGIGVIDTHTRLNTTFVKGMPPQGHIAFLSQSGALCGGVIDWAMGRAISGGFARIGFSRLLSVGNEADVNETDMLPLLAADDLSRVIVLYLEDVKGGPAFVEALREAVERKPVLVLKAGRTASGQAATASHTGALASAHAAFRAACLQTGAVEVGGIERLFNGALALACQPPPEGNRVAIVTNSGGPAALAADAFEAARLRLAHVGERTAESLRRSVHRDVQTLGPIDLLGGADERDYLKATELVLADPAVDGVLVNLVPQVLVNTEAVVEAIAAAARAQTGRPKPVLLCLMGEASLEGAHRAATAAELPAYTFPEDAAAAFGILWQRARWLERSRRVGREQRGRAAGERRRGRAVEQRSREAEQGHAGGAALEFEQVRALLEAYGIPTPREMLATSPQEAAAMAKAIGFPVALKLVSPDVLHKTDVGGVILGVQDEQAARAGHETLIARASAIPTTAGVRGVLVQKMITGGQEVIVGIKRDPTFGPLVMFGLGGVYVEALADVSFRLAPLTTADAWDMIEEVRSAKLLEGLRGAAPADRTALVDLIVRVGRLAADHPEIAEVDLNPVLVLPEGRGLMPVDARVILAS
jgi:acetyl coenzyme A synthetase (ADP forming)-like protein